MVRHMLHRLPAGQLAACCGLVMVLSSLGDAQAEAPRSKSKLGQGLAAQYDSNFVVQCSVRVANKGIQENCKHELIAKLRGNPIASHHSPTASAQRRSSHSTPASVCRLLGLCVHCMNHRGSCPRVKWLF